MDNRKAGKGLSNTNRINRNKKIVTIGSLMEEGGNHKSTKGKGSMVKASSPELPVRENGYRRTCPGLGNPALKKRRRRQRKRGSFSELISLIQMGVIKPPYIFSKYSAWQRGYGFQPLNEKRANTEAHHIDNVHVVFIDKEIHRKFATQDKNEHRELIEKHILNYIQM